jgi:SPX domain protein involved in polyphosphate accumulation
MLLQGDIIEARSETVRKTSGQVEEKEIRSYRYERKFLLENHASHTIEGVVHLHPGQFSSVFLPRFINNIYLDTPLFLNYRDAVDGIADRIKVRIRWYGDMYASACTPHLEIKGKKGNVCYKSVYPLKGFGFSGGIGVKNITSLLKTSDLPAEIKNYLLYLKPVLVNRYRRKYWLSRDRRYRLTLDHDLWFGRFVAFNNKTLRHAPEDRTVILEIKYHPDDDDSFPELANGFAFRQTRSSKYVTGMDHIYRLGSCG